MTVTRASLYKPVRCVLELVVRCNSVPEGCRPFGRWCSPCGSTDSIEGVARRVFDVAPFGLSPVHGTCSVLGQIGLDIIEIAVSRARIHGRLPTCRLKPAGRCCAPCPFWLHKGRLARYAQCARRCLPQWDWGASASRFRPKTTTTAPIAPKRAPTGPPTRSTTILSPWEHRQFHHQRRRGDEPGSPVIGSGLIVAVFIPVVVWCP